MTLNHPHQQQNPARTLNHPSQRTRAPGLVTLNLDRQPKRPPERSQDVALSPNGARKKPPKRRPLLINSLVFFVLHMGPLPLLKTNLATQAKSQWIVTTRLLCHLQSPVAHSSRPLAISPRTSV